MTYRASPRDALPPYNPSGACPKCRNRFVRTEYRGAADVLARICERCGYQWPERPFVSRKPWGVRA